MNNGIACVLYTYVYMWGNKLLDTETTNSYVYMLSREYKHKYHLYVDSRRFNHRYPVDKQYLLAFLVFSN